MASHITALRAAGSFFAQRMIRFATLIALGVFLLLCTATWALAYYLSHWWWLLLVIIVPLGVVAFVISTIARLVARTLYRTKLTKQQKKLTANFVDKIQGVIEKTGFSFAFIVLTMMKDLLFYRDLRTLNNFVEDTSSLKRDLDELAHQLP